MNWESVWFITKRLKLESEQEILRFGMNWKTLWGFIKGYSASNQKSIPPEQIISRDLKNICDLDQSFQRWCTFCLFVFLISIERYFQ